MSAKQSRAMLRDMLGADIDASKRVSVSKTFADDFEAVATHYQLRERGEYEAAKAAARADLDAAISTFSTLAEEIRSGTA